MKRIGLMSYGGATKCTINLGILSVLRPHLIGHVTDAFGNSAGVACMQAFMTDQCDAGIEATARYLNIFRLLQRPWRGIVNLDYFRRHWLENTLDLKRFWESPITPHVGVYNVEGHKTQYIVPTPHTLIPLFMGSSSLPRLTRRVYHEIDGRETRLLDGGLEDLTGYMTIRRDFPEITKLIIVGHIPYMTEGYRYPEFLRNQILRRHRPDHPAKDALIKSYQVFMDSWSLMESDPDVLYLGPEPTVQGKSPVNFVDTPNAIRRGYLYGQARGHLALKLGELSRFLSQ
jgi:predicted patatin/cPLA2 family phospholipase